MTEEPPADDDSETPPVACTLSEEGYQQRTPWMASAFLPLLEDVEQRDAGLVMTFDGADETVETVARFVNEESDCCAFARYDISIEPPYDETTLTVSGPEGTADVFSAELMGALDDLPESLDDMPEAFAAVHEPS